MKIKILLLALPALIMFSCTGGDDSTAKKEELKKIVLDYYSALAQKDLSKAIELTTGNFVYCEDGLFFSSQSAISEVAKMKPFTVSFTIDSLNIHMDKRDASAYYFRDAQFNFADSSMHLRFFETATFNKDGSAWKLRVIHSSSLR